MIRRKDIEIMAPVGSFDSLAAAINAGADAVYFGTGNLNMRSQSAVNFTPEDIAEVARQCRKHNMRSYLTLNTIMYDEDLAGMETVLQKAKEAGVSAIIASDIAAIEAGIRYGHEIHISTQVNVSNIEAVRFYSRFADVVVLARELNMEQVHHIYDTIVKEQIKGPSGKLIQLEMFCHGALCMAVSGKCYLSLHEHNHSANRGSCLQVCRRSYTVKESETGVELDVTNPYIMSPKDLCTIGFLDKLTDAGVRVLKIEGRARPAEYVKIVVECYSEALLSLENGTYSKEKIDGWMQRLSQVFNRGFWNGYYLGQKLGEWNDSYGSKATRKKVYLAKCTNYFSKLGVGEFLLETGELKIGDEVLISGSNTGARFMKVSELRLDRDPVEKVLKGQVFSMPVEDIVRRSDKLYGWEEVKR
jgi:U32 family peptidase